MTSFDAIAIGHVADVLQSHHDIGDYDAAADMAANLLGLYPALVAAADAYATGPNTLTAMGLRDAVAEAVRGRLPQ